ncbi:hypothetical protein E9232_004621 [Inquilinus ginsengisoli]|uniref:Lysozyme inhibitor LprI-like N-terminal domain-containing protein n=1 Tax=Inquilinus ginsengisoli TaxID=363840 RepID=A0ABU1JTY8_9PROT|nr:lysozyme inhibitor LprI family protein [Inquilinus ginsengisoli]MDR6292083.1 hypothetical protein [Inquilinus ginsengisoli]
MIRTGLLVLAAALLGTALPARAEQVLTVEILAVKAAPADTGPAEVNMLLRLTDESGIDVLRPEGDCDSTLPGIGQTTTECYALAIVENSVPIGRYAYHILETRSTDSFLLVTYPSTATGDRGVSLRIDYNGFYNHDPETVLMLSDYDNGTLDPKDPFESLHRLYAGKLKAFAAELAENLPSEVNDAAAKSWRDAFMAAQRKWAQFVESDCVLAARLAGEAQRSRCLADRTMERIDQLDTSFSPD